MNCANCFHKFEGHYCNQCGQKAGDLKYTIKGMVTDLFFSAFHVEKKGLFHTVRELTLQPGIAIKKVIKGQRLSLYPPFKYLVLMGTVVIVLSLRYKFFHNEYTQLGNGESSLPEWLVLSSEHKLYLESFFKFAEDEATLLNIVAIPIFAMLSWSLLSRGKFNFAENLIVNTFITAQQLFFLIPLVPILEIFPPSRQVLVPIYTIATMFYNVWVYYQFFEGARARKAIVCVLTVALAYIYQLPTNLLVYHLYENYIHKHLHWIPNVVY